MDLNKLDSKGKKGIIPKTWERCKSFGRKNSSENNQHALTTKRARKLRFRVSTQGCFSVYVGSDKQRFAIKTEYVNHPLFKMLLDEAESEFGYNSKGPLVLPCDVEFFLNLLMELDSNEANQHGCGFTRSYSYYHLTPTIFAS